MHERVDRFGGGDARRPARMSEQRHLTEEVAGSEIVDGPSHLDLRGTGQDHEEAAAIGVALDERLARRERPPLSDLRDALEVVVGELLEEADLAERLAIARHVMSPGDFLRPLFPRPLLSRAWLSRASRSS